MPLGNGLDWRIGLVIAEHRTGIDEDRRTQAQFARARAQRNLELGVAEIVELAAQRIVDDLVAVGHGDADCHRRRSTIGLAQHARADAANVEAADLRLAEEEAVGQANIVDPLTDEPRFSSDLIAPPSPEMREDEALPKRQVLRRIDAQAGILDRTAKPGEVAAEHG